MKSESKPANQETSETDETFAARAGLDELEWDANVFPRDKELAEVKAEDEEVKGEEEDVVVEEEAHICNVLTFIVHLKVDFVIAVLRQGFEPDLLLTAFRYAAQPYQGCGPPNREIAT